MAETVWTVRALLDWTRDFFRRKNVEEPRLSAEILLSHVLGCPRLGLYLKHGDVPDDAHRTRLRELVTRRAEHEPLAYLVGSTTFFSFEFAVTPAVLIPRPETEMLVEQVMADAKPHREKPIAPPPPNPHLTDPNAPQPSVPVETPSPGVATSAKSDNERPDIAPVVIELCTGSGCVAVSIAKLLPKSTVTATDLSPDALAVARINAEKLKVGDRIKLLHGDLFAALPADHPPADYLLANPPYIPAGEVSKLDPTVKNFEPKLALSGGADGLDVIRRIVVQAGRYLKGGGLLLIEIGHNQSAAAEALLSAVPGFTEISTLPDFQGHPRLLRSRYRT